MKKKENPNATIGINDEWLENIFDRKLILPNDMKDSEIIKEFVEEIQQERNNESSVNRGCIKISMVNWYIKIDGVAVPN